MRRHRSPYDTHPGEAINHAKFDACTPSGFGGVKTPNHTRRKNCALYIDSR